MAKILIDTSVQIGRFKHKEIDEFIKRSSLKAKMYSSNYVLFEFKVGLIKTLIDYWDTVNIYDTPSEAQIKWSERYAIRDAKNLIILQALISRNIGSVSSDKKKYLRQIESIILMLTSNFMTGIEKKLLGDFANDEIVRYDIKSKSDYYGFIKKCEEKKHMIDQTVFWSERYTELDLLLLSPELKRDYEAVHKALENIKKDIKYANMQNTNRKLGDCVIAIDAPAKTQILSTDNSFKVLGEILKKRYLIIPNQY